MGWAEAGCELAGEVVAGGLLGGESDAAGDWGGFENGYVIEGAGRGEDCCHGEWHGGFRVRLAEVAANGFG